MKLHLSGRAIAFAVTILLAATAAPAWSESPPLKLGQFFDLTGGAATVAEASKFGTDVAIDEINRNGGIGGRKIVTVLADTQTDPTVGVGEIKRLVLQEKVDFVVGPVISQVLLAVLPVLNDAKILSLSAVGSDAATPAAGPYNFSIMVNAKSQAQIMVQQAVENAHAKTAVVLSDTGAQAKSFIAALKTETAAKGLDLKDAQEYQYHATDLTPQVLALKRSNPDVLFLLSTSGEDVAAALKALGEIGWDVKVIGTYSVGGFSQGAIKIVGADAFANVTGVNYKAFTYCPTGGDPKPYGDFVAKARAFDAKRAGSLSLPVAGFFYDTIYLLKDAVEGTGGKTDGPTLAAWIEENAKNFHGVDSQFNANKQTHFLIGLSNLAIVLPAKMRDGIYQERINCP